MKKAHLASALVIGALTIITTGRIAIAELGLGQGVQQTCSPNTPTETSEQTSSLEHETPFKIGGRVKPPRLLSSPTPKDHPSPAPPGQKGYAIVSYVVSSTGIPNRIHIVRSEGAFERNAQKVIDIIQRSRFNPAPKMANP